MIIATELEVEQNTEEWFAARLGLVTSSELNNVLMDPKKAGYKNYHAQILLEQLTGKTPERFSNKYTDWGHEMEDVATMGYTLRTGNMVRKCGIFIHKFMKLGDSPDGIVIDKAGCVEVKCKNSANHLEAIKTNHMPKEHLPQVQNHIQMTGSEWCDYISFDPDFPPNSQLFIERIYKDEPFCKRILLESSLFLDEVAEDIKILKEYKVKTWN